MLEVGVAIRRVIAILPGEIAALYDSSNRRVRTVFTREAL